MSVEEACHAILGDELAHAIIGSMGVHWAVVAAMAQAMEGDNPEAIRTLRDHTRASKGKP